MSPIAESLDIDYVNKIISIPKNSPDAYYSIRELHNKMLEFFDYEEIINNHLVEVRDYLRRVERMPHSKCSEVDALIIKRQPDIIKLLKKKYPEEFV